MGLSELVKWSFLAGIGQTTPIRLTALVPLIGTLLILNENTADWLKLSPMLAPNTDDAGRHLLTVNSLYFTYFGLCLLGIGSMIFHFRCPIDIKRYQSATHIAERSDDSPVISQYRFWEMLRLYFGAKGIRGPENEPNFSDEKLDMPDMVTSSFSGLILSMFEKAEYTQGYIAEVDEEEFLRFHQGPHGRLDTDAVAGLVWHRTHFNHEVWEEFERLAMTFHKDISYLRYMMLDVSSFYARLIVAILFLSGFAILSVPTVRTFISIGSSLLVPTM
jgi:hypothetical protein